MDDSTESKNWEFQVLEVKLLLKHNTGNLTQASGHQLDKPSVWTTNWEQTVIEGSKDYSLTCMSFGEDFGEHGGLRLKEIPDDIGDSLEENSRLPGRWRNDTIYVLLVMRQCMVKKACLKPRIKEALLMYQSSNHCDIIIIIIYTVELIFYFILC